MPQKFKRYKSQDNQSDIFGPVWPYVKKLHRLSQSQVKGLLPMMFKYGWARLFGKTIGFNSTDLKGCTLAIDPDQGRFLYNLVLAKKPKTILEYGTSFGISTVYLAQALKELQSGQIVGTEIELSKAEKAMEHLKACQLHERVHILVGDVLKTCRDFNQPIDMLVMDGFPGLNLQVLKQLEPFLEKGCLIITDDVYLFKKEMRDYLDYLEKSPQYSTQILAISDGMGLSMKRTPSHHSPSKIDSSNAAEDAAQAIQESFKRKD